MICDALHRIELVDEPAVDAGAVGFFGAIVAAVPQVPAALRGAAVQAWAAVRLKAASSAASGWRSRTRRTSHSNHSGRIRWRPTAS